MGLQHLGWFAWLKNISHLERLSEDVAVSFIPVTSFTSLPFWIPAHHCLRKGHILE